MLLFVMMKIYGRQRRRLSERNAELQALLQAAYGFESCAEQISVQIRAGTLSVAEGIERLTTESMVTVVSATTPSLRMKLFKGEDPEWVFIRRLSASVTRLACQPQVPSGVVKYVDFETGAIRSQLPPLLPGSKRFVVISDTHMRHSDVWIPSGDVLIHSGDVMNFGGDPVPPGCDPWKPCLDHFLSWLTEQCSRCPEVVFIGGNHDGYLEHLGPKTLREMLPDGITYLCDSETTLAGGIRVYGTPFSFTQATTGNIAFQNASGDPQMVSRTMAAIPGNIDVLITHGPPQMAAAPFGFKPPPWNASQKDFGIYGCKELTETVQRINPRVHIFGHVHESHGAQRVGETLFISGSSVSSSKTCALNPPIVFDLPHWIRA